MTLTGCSLFGGERPKPVERAEFDQLTGRVVHLEDVVLKNPAVFTPGLTPAGSPGLTPGLAPPVAPVRPTRGQEWSRYQRALGQVKSRRYSQAAAAFEAMLAENPAGSLAPNARYWLGECYYAQGDFTRALVEFSQGFRDYPTSNKAPDYLLKMSYSQSRLGDGPGAMESMRVLLERYPESNSARLVKSGRTRF
ncbi:MAG: tol-pal system protein YbgF [Deltaproteobacteria bacterium]|jgi:tol-pal system protein YbgF|nr:tol-pal system protein YbgF [Deltaproteobacteria bacterium]